MRRSPPSVAAPGRSAGRRAWPSPPSRRRPGARRRGRRAYERVGAERLVIGASAHRRDDARGRRRHGLRPRLSLASHGDRHRAHPGRVRGAFHPDDRPQARRRTERCRRREALIEGSGRPLLIMAEEVHLACVVHLLGRREVGHPPSRRSIRRNTAIGARQCSRTSPSQPAARVIARELGGKLERVSDCRDLGGARPARISAEKHIIRPARGDAAPIAALAAGHRRNMRRRPEHRARTAPGAVAEFSAARRSSWRAARPGGAEAAHADDRGFHQRDAGGDTGWCGFRRRHRAAAESHPSSRARSLRWKSSPAVSGWGRVFCRARSGQPLALLVTNCGGGCRRGPGPPVSRRQRGFGFDARSGEDRGAAGSEACLVR